MLDESATSALSNPQISKSKLTKEAKVMVATISFQTEVGCPSVDLIRFLATRTRATVSRFS